MKAHKKTKLFRHFMTILNMLALAVPMVVLGFHALNDSLPKFFASQSVQHHGGESDVFSDDLDYANEQLKTRSLDDNLMLTMDSMNYMNYGVQNSYTQIEYNYQTNVVNSHDDIFNGNIYEIRFVLPPTTGTITDISLSSSISTFSFPNLGDSFYLRYRSSLNNDASNIILLLNSNFNYLYTYGVKLGYQSLGYFPFYVIVNNKDDVIFRDNYYTFHACPKEYIPYTIKQNASITNITSLDDWKTYYNNKNYAQIIDTGVSTHLPINVDFVSIFTQSDIINHDGNIATLLFINFYCNWILNISLIIFFPQVIMCFINWAIDLIYKFTEVKGD